MTVPLGETVTLATGDRMSLWGTVSDPAVIQAYGTFTTATGSYIECDGGNTEIIALAGGSVSLNGTTYLDCPGACLASVGSGTLALGAHLEVASGAFLNASSSTMTVGDYVQVDYTSSVDPVFSGGTIKMGRDASIVFSGDTTRVIGTQSNPVVFEALGAYNWDRIEVRGDSSEFRHVEISGADYGLYLRATDLIVDSSRVHDNDYGIYTNSDYDSGGDSEVQITYSSVYDNDSNGLHLYKVDATIQYDSVYGNGTNGIYASSAYLSDTKDNNVYDNNRGINFYNSGTDSTFYRNYFHDNTQYGAYLSGTSTINAWSCCNNFSENDGHEIFVNGSSSRFYPSIGSPLNVDGAHDIPDTSMPGGTYLIYNNVSGWTMPATGNYWGTSSPTSSLFAGSGSVDYSSHLTTSPATGPGGSYRIGSTEEEQSIYGGILLSTSSSGAGTSAGTSGLKSAIANLRSFVAESDDAQNISADITRLYDLITLDESDATGERSSTIALIDALISEFLAASPSAKANNYAIVANGEAAVLARTREFLRPRQYGALSSNLASYRAATESDHLQAELYVATAIAKEHAGDLSGARDALTSAESVADGNVYSYGTFDEERARLASLPQEAGQSSRAGLSEFDRVERDNLTIEPVVLEGAIFPNPADDVVQFRLSDQPSGDVLIEVYDVVGRRVSAASRRVDESGRLEGSLDTRSLASGLYLIRFTDSEGTRSQASLLRR